MRPALNQSLANHSYPISAPNPIVSQGFGDPNLIQPLRFTQVNKNGSETTRLVEEDEANRSYERRR